MVSLSLILSNISKNSFVSFSSILSKKMSLLFNNVLNKFMKLSTTFSFGSSFFKIILVISNISINLILALLLI